MQTSAPEGESCGVERVPETRYARPDPSHEEPR